MTRQSQPDTHQMLIAGNWVDALDGQVIEVENPGRRSVFATVPRAQLADLENAVEAAQKAFQSWRKIAPRDRGKLLLDIATALESDLETMAHNEAYHQRTKHMMCDIPLSDILLN